MELSKEALDWAASKQKALDDSQNECEKHQRTILDLERQLRERSQISYEEKDRRVRVESEFEMLQREFNALKTRYESLSEETRTAKHELQMARDYADVVTEERDQVRVEFKELSERNHDLHMRMLSDRSTFNSEVRSLKLRLEETEKQRDQFNDECNSLLEQIEELNPHRTRRAMAAADLSFRDFFEFIHQHTVEGLDVPVIPSDSLNNGTKGWTAWAHKDGVEVSSQVNVPLTDFAKFDDGSRMLVQAADLLVKYSRHLY